MLSLEQVQLLESKVSKAIEYVKKVSAENNALLEERESLLTKLDANQKRLDELEVLVMRFKEDQGRIEDGIIAALDRLSQFEEAFESSLKDADNPKVSVKKPPIKKPAKQFQAAESDSSGDVSDSTGEPGEADESDEFFEITGTDIENAAAGKGSSPADEPKKSKGNAAINKESSSEAELDIF